MVQTTPTRRDTTTPARPAAPARRRGRVAATLSVLALAALSPLGAGCGPGGPFGGPPIQVAQTPDQAFKDGLDKQEAARKALEANRRADAAKLWGDTATYYGAVADKYKGAESGLQAVLLQSQAMIQQIDASTALGQTRNYTNAQVTLRNALKQYPAYAFAAGSSGAALREQAQREYDALLEKMDAENATSTYYKVMDALVNGLEKLGADRQAAPILAITLIALAVNLVTWPLVRKQMKSAKEFSRYQPELKKLQEKYKSDPQEAFLKQQAFMKEHGINQFAGCLPALAQWPITLVMYYVILYYQFHFRGNHFLWVNPASAAAAESWPGPLRGIIGHNLSENDFPLLLLYAGAMWVQGKLTPVTPNADPAVIEQQKMMTNMMPIILMITMISWQPPAAFVVYWIISIIFGAARYWWINKTLPTPAPLVLNADGSVAGGGDAGGAAKPMSANPKLVSPKNRPAGGGSSAGSSGGGANAPKKK